MRIGVRDVAEFLVIPLLTAAVFILWDLNKSVGDLNVRVGVLLANGEAYKDRLDRLEKRVEKIEDKNSGDIARQ